MELYGLMAKTRTSHSHRQKPRKQRTRGHVIADWSAHHVERFVLDNGYVAERLLHDYGYDVTVITFDEEGYAESGEIKLQLKATDDISQFEVASGGHLSFKIDRVDFELWMGSIYPGFLILYDAQTRRAYWQYVQAFFSDRTHTKPTTRSLQLHIPVVNVLRKSTIQMMRRKKAEVLEQTRGIKHA